MNTQSGWERRSSTPRLDLPVDKPSQRRSAVRRARTEFLIHSAACEALNRLANGKQTELSTILLAAFNAMLLRYTGQTEITVATNLPKLPDVSTLLKRPDSPVLLRTMIFGDPTFSAFAEQVQNIVLQSAERAET